MRMGFAKRIVFVAALSFLSLVAEGTEVIARLPKTIIPSFYRLDINTRFKDKNFTFQGEVWIDIEAVEATNEIILHSKGLHIFEEATSLELLTPSTQHFDLLDTWQGLGFEKSESNRIEVNQNDENTTPLSQSPTNVVEEVTPPDDSTRIPLCNATLVPVAIENSTSSVVQRRSGESTPSVWSLLYETPRETVSIANVSSTNSNSPRESTTSVWELLFVKPNATTYVPNLESNIRDPNRIVDTLDTGGHTKISTPKEESIISAWELLFKNPNATTSMPSSEADTWKPGQNLEVIGPTYTTNTASNKDESTTKIWAILYQDNASTLEQNLAPSTGSASGVQHEATKINGQMEESTTRLNEQLGGIGLKPHMEAITPFSDDHDSQKETHTSVTTMSTTSVWSLLFQEQNSSIHVVNEDVDGPTRSFDNITSYVTSSPNLVFDITEPTNKHKVVSKNTIEIPIDGISIDKEKDFLIVKLKQKLDVAAKYRIHFKFSGILTNGIAGYNKMSYKDISTNETKWMTSTVFEPMEARRAFPCFDEPTFKARFQINLVRPKMMTSLSNMPLRKTYPIIGQPDLEVDSFEESPLMSTYLVAFHVGNLGYRESTTHTGKPFRVYARPHILAHTDYALEVGPKIQQFLGNYLDVEDPLNKTDLLALPLPLGDALENWGLISFFNEKSLTHEGPPSISSQLKVATILAHELSHTWFGNLVTLEWWSDIWLNEGFATYFAGLAVDHVHPEWDFQSVLTIRAFLQVFSIDSLQTSHALAPEVTNKTSTLSLFDRISYYKGHYILRMLKYMVGESTFRKGCIRYVKQNVYGNVKQNDFWDIMTKQGHEDGTLPSTMNLTNVMKAWTRQPGFPVITVLRDYKSNAAHIVQSRFLRPKYDVELRSGDDEDTVWWIPLTYTSQTEMDFNTTKPRIWVDPQDLVTTVNNLPDKDQWIMFNIQATGFYRVNYDLHNWELINRYLASEDLEKVDVLNRAQLLDDVFNFARAGDVPYSTALNMTKYLKHERHYLPWMSVLHNLEYVMRMLRGTNISDEFKDFVKLLISPEFDRLGLQSRSGESMVDTMNRQQIVHWACLSGVNECIQKAVEQYKLWIELAEKDSTNTNPIANDVRATVYCTAVEHGSEHEWVFLWHRYLQRSQDADRSSILSALGCTRDTQILKRFLDMTIKENSGIKKQHGVNVFKAVASNDVGHDLAKAFLNEKFNDIHHYNGDRSHIHFQILLDMLASKMNRQTELEELQEFEKNHKSNFRDSYSLEISNDKVKFNIEWLKRNYDPISRWLKSQKI